MPEPYGSFRWLCREAPLVSCNLLFAQVFKSNSHLDVLFPQSSPFFQSFNITDATRVEEVTAHKARITSGTGIGSECMIPRAGERSSIGDVALYLVSLISLPIIAWMTFMSVRRRRGRARKGLLLFAAAFMAHTFLQVLTMSSLLAQGSQAMIVLSAIHCAVVITLVWLLIFNVMILAAKNSSMTSDHGGIWFWAMSILCALIFLGALYMMIAIAYGDRAFKIVSSPDVEYLRSKTLFTLTVVWPPVGLFLSFIGMVVIGERQLRKRSPTMWLLGSVVALTVGIVFLLVVSQPICKHTTDYTRWMTREELMANPRQGDRKEAPVNGAFLMSISNLIAFGLFLEACS